VKVGKFSSNEAACFQVGDRPQRRHALHWREGQVIAGDRLGPRPGMLGNGGGQLGHGGDDRTRTPHRRQRRLAVHRTARPPHPVRHQRGSGRSRCGAWWRPRSPTGTAARATRTCIPMSRSRTRCRPLMGADCPSTDGSCSRPRLRRRKPITPRWRTTSAEASASGSPNGPTRTQGCGRSERLSASTPL
jgi:hypothetical protein